MPPHNPNVHELVQGKRKWSNSLKHKDVRRGFRGWNERGYLPHRDEPGLTQFVTFRLDDSFPETLRSEWEHLLRIENDELRRAQLEAYLDKGRGGCFLRKPEIAAVVEEALRRFHGERYELLAWSIMPNHVHVLFKVDSVPMSEILESWKKYSGFKANRLLGRRGAFWQLDYWDTFIRDIVHELEIRTYIENNPTKAGLVLEPKAWPFGSARLRDAQGVLNL